MKIELVASTSNKISNTKLVTFIFNGKLFTCNHDSLTDLEIYCENKGFEFQEIAEMLYDLYQEAEWKESKYHIPFEKDIVNLYDYELKKYTSGKEDYYDKLMRISASMCAKLSYNTQENDDTLDKHLERAEMLMTHKHWEPFSHQAIAMDEKEYRVFNKSRKVSMFKIEGKDGKYNPQDNSFIEYGWCYNLRGFISLRYMLENY